MSTECCANKLNHVVNSTEHQTYMGFTGGVQVPLTGVMFKDMLKEMETESTLGFPDEEMKRERSGNLVDKFLFISH